MKVISLLLILSSFLLSSCGIFSKYGLLSSSQGGVYFDLYHAQLSQQDINRLNNGEEIFIKYKVDWQYFKEAGELRVLPTTKPDVFNFIEIGVWESEGEFERNKSHKGKEKTLMVHDSLGNVLSVKNFQKLHHQDQFILIEEWQHISEEHNGKDFQLHHIKSYHQDGVIYKDMWYNLPEFEIPKNWAIKKRVPVKYKRKYRKDGALKKEVVYDMNGKVLERKRIKN